MKKKKRKEMSCASGALQWRGKKEQRTKCEESYNGGEKGMMQTKRIGQSRRLSLLLSSLVCEPTFGVF